MIAPEASVRAEVKEWLHSNGATCVDMPTSLKCEATAGQVETMLSTKLSTFRHLAKNGRLVHRIHPDQGWTFPQELVGKMLFMTNLADFPTVDRRHGVTQHTVNKQTGAPEATDYFVALETVRKFYGMESVTNATGSKLSTSAPAEFQADEAITKADLKQFATNMGVGDWNITHKTGAFSGSDTEATLDVEYIGGVGLGNDQWWWDEADWQ
jgi:hypothetical protein